MAGQRRSRGPGWLATIGLDPTPFAVLGVGALAVLVGAVIWVGASIAGWIVGEPNQEPFAAGIGLLITIVRAGGPTAVWPAIPPPVLAAGLGLVAVVTVAAGGGLVMLGRWLLPALDAGRDGGGLADASDLALFGRRHRRSEAVRLRHNLTTAPTDDDIGLPLGKLDGGRPTMLWAGLEDTTTSWMAPRSGKTTALAIPHVLAAPGPVVATSNKADLWAATATMRARTGGRVWTFDPQAVVHAPCDWHWNPLAAITTFEHAQNLATMFLPERASEDRNRYFTDRGRLYLTYLLLAAASTPTPMLADVDRWLDHPRDVEPVNHLGTAGHHNAQRALAAFVTENSSETIEGVYSTARTATGCFKSDTIMRWVTPNDGRPPLNPEAFITSNDSLYLLSRDGELSAAPLVAAFVDRLFRAARTRAEASPLNRLDPPLVTILDEAANIVKIPTLPDNYSYFGGMGILVHAIFQSLAQARSTWGRIGAEKLWSASTVKIIGSGIDDPELAATLSKFVGEHHVDTRSVSASARMGTNHQVSTTKEPIWTPADIRQLPTGQALLLATGHRPALITLRPWYRSTAAAQITADADANYQLIQQRASACAGPQPVSPTKEIAR